MHLSSVILPLLAASPSMAFVSLRTENARSALCMAGDEFAFKATSAAEKYNGGPVTADMNDYNLDLEEASNEWSASLVQNSNSLPDGVYLEAKSNAMNFIDTITLPIKRKEGEGLGIELTELAGGRDDGVGITIVSGLVEGAVSESSGLVAGDSIVQMSIVTGDLENEVATINTECLDWDATVGKIGSLPPFSGDATEKLLVKVKRLRRLPKVSVTVQSDGSSKKLNILAGQNLRREMLNQGVPLKDKYAKAFLSGEDKMGDCGSTGGCGLCKIAVTEGAELLNEPDDDEKSVASGSNERLSCRTIVGYGLKEGSITVQLVD